MYTNMTFAELLSAVRNAITGTGLANYVSIPVPDTDDLIFLLQCVLQNNVFEFNGKYYKQTIGAAMGCAPSPSICDMRMYEITKDIIANYEFRHKIIYHGRFRDDDFMIFEGSTDEAVQFFTICNNYHPLLKFTYEISESNMTFLDTQVYKGDGFQKSGTLDIKSFIKPTNTFQYLHRTSAHSKSVFKGFIKGKCIRHARNTSDRQILIKQLQDFETHLIQRGYSGNEIQPIIRDACSTDRNELIHNQKHKQKSKTIPNVMVTKYDPRIKGIKKKLMKYWSSVLKDKTCQKIFTTEPIVAYSKHKNIGDIITSSILH